MLFSFRPRNVGEVGHGGTCPVVRSNGFLKSLQTNSKTHIRPAALVIRPAQIYLVNTFTVHSVSALAAMNILRSLNGGLLPLPGQGPYDYPGKWQGNSLFAFIALAFAPVPVLLKL